MLPAPRRDRLPLTRLFGAALAGLLGAGALAQGTPAAPGTPGTQAPPATLDEAIERMGELRPEPRLGRRAQLMRQTQRVLPVVVIVEHEDAFIEALGAWRGPQRFPILFDDASAEAREHIARFVRAFGPDRVLRWTPDEHRDDVARDARPGRVRDAFAAAYGDATGALDPGDPVAAAEALVRAGVTPPGIVVADPGDDAWLAAATLAVARAQPILWTNLAGTPNGTMPAADFVPVRQRIEQFAERTGLGWRTLGDDLDSVTLCGETVTKISLSSTPPTATAATDLVARRLDDQAERWAWAGQIFGSRARTVYQAMCSVFLQARDAWLFDGYRNEPGFAEYDQSGAQPIYQRAGLSTRVTDLPNNSIDSWRIKAARGIGAWARPDRGDAENTPPSPDGRGALVASVTTSGNDWFFKLNPGQGHAGDAPLLMTPAATMFTHSWSARRPANRATIAARWLERGAFVYHGSVQEPFLQAFATPAQAASRLAGGAPFAAALQKARPDPWKLAVYGDPLWTFGPAGTRLTIDWENTPAGALPVPVRDGESVDAAMRAALQDGAYDDALEALVVLGRDADAARLVRAVTGSDGPGAAIDPAPVAGALVRAGEQGVLITLAARRRTAFDDPVVRDFVWDAARSELLFGDTDLALAVLPTMLREDTRASDAIEYARSLARLRDGTAAVGFLRRIQGETENERDKRRLGDAIRGYGG